MSSSNESSSLPDSSPSSTASSSPPLVPLSPFQELKEALCSKSSKNILEHCLGINKLANVPPLCDNIIVVCFDTESWVSDHDKLTEIGIATFDSRDMRAVVKPGMHGEELLKQIYFYHARIQENAHLINIKYCVGDPTANHFGQTRFLSSSDACNMLDSIFHLPIDPNRPELGNCPVVVVGHALNNDFSILSRTLGIHTAIFETVVHTIDTQNLCVQIGFWRNRNQAGLASLAYMSGFQYRDPYTACNDAAMTLFCAIQMVLPAHLKPANGEDGENLDTALEIRSFQDIIDDIEVSSKSQAWSFGTNKFCIRCGRESHLHFVSKKQKCSFKVMCEHCAVSQKEDRQKAARGHITKNCIFFALRGPEVAVSKEDVVTGLGQAILED